MASEAELILRTLDRFMTGHGTIRLLGGAAFILGYGRSRATEDADLVMDDAEVIALMEHCGFSEAVVATNDELAPKGLYLTHIWGPEQQILTPQWRESCRAVQLAAPFVHIALEVLGPLDLICSKLARGDEADLEDVRYLIEREHLEAETIRLALARAVVPDILGEIFHVTRARLAQLIA